MTGAAAKIDSKPDLDQARYHLIVLDPAAQAFVFQTFDDSTRKDPTLARVISGPFDKCADQLSELNRRGAGVFVTVNRSSNGGRKKADIVTARAVWREADEPYLAQLPITPHLVVETSPGKHHEYLLTDTTDFDAWDAVMRTMVGVHGSDPNAKDRSRVLRLAGFYHCKGTPHMVRIVEENDRPRYALDEIAKYIPPAKPVYEAHQKKVNQQTTDRYAASALSRELTELACAPEHTRNNQLNTAAFNLGQLIAGGELDRGHVENALASAAIGIGLQPNEVQATIRSGLDAGIAKPRKAPERPESRQRPEWEPESEEKPEPEEKPRFQFIHNAELLRDLRPISWRIDGILLDNAFYYNFGDSGTFKTFIELDRLLCIAAGIPYHGHQVKQGTVFYIAGEGQQGIGRRIAAWHIAHGTQAADVPFFVARVPTQLMDIAAVDNVRAAVDALSNEYGPPAVTHFDTLARNFGDGDENATKDMNRVIANMDLAFGNDFCRGLTHHTGHANKDRARGSYALHAGADIAFRMEPVTGTDRIIVECKKMKDAPPAPPMVFEKRKIVLQIGDERDTTFVMDFVCEGDEAAGMNQPAEFGMGKTGKGRNQSIAMDELNRLYDEHRKNLSGGGYDPADARVTIEDWRNACDNRGMNRHAFYKVKTSLMGNGQIKMDKVHVYTNTN